MGPCQEKVGEKVSQAHGMGEMPEASISATSNSSTEELARVQREKEVAARSLFYPSVQPSPNLFSLFTKPSLPVLGEKISDLSGIDTAPVRLVSKQAFPSLATAESIYDIASPQPVHDAKAIDEVIDAAKDNLEKIRQQTLDKAKVAKEPEEITASVEEIIDVLNQSQEELVEEALKGTPFPNLALEILMLGLKMESFQTGKISEYKQEGDGYRKKISQLLDLSSQLPKVTSDNSSYNLEETKKEILESHEKLKAMGIDIFPGLTIDQELSKEQLAAANSLINHHIDVSRTSLQELFSTKISLAIQFLSMMGEVMKKVCEKDNHLKEKANQLPH